MINTLAVSGYRSLRDIKLELGPLNIITGANGSGKSSLYRALRLLSDIAQGRAIASLASEGGLQSTLWAGPEKISREMRDGRTPVQGTVRTGPISLKLGFSAEDYGYAIDLGLPGPSSPAFANDPEIKTEAIWTGPVLGRSNTFAERRGPLVKIRSGDTGSWQQRMTDLSTFDSMMTHCADPGMASNCSFFVNECAHGDFMKSFVPIGMHRLESLKSVPSLPYWRVTEAILAPLSGQF